MARNAEAERPRTAQSFLISKANIVSQDYDLSINRYKEVVYEAVAYDPPQLILRELHELENAIQEDMRELETMLA